jgi:uncharacterized protein YjbI with pentapeptide repeats
MHVAPNSRPTVESWSSRNGKRLLLELARGEVAPGPTFKRLGLPYWEQTILRRTLRARKGFASQTISEQKRIWLTRSLAQTLDSLRSEAPDKRPRLAKQQRRFRGNRKQLDLLERSLNSPIEINEWNDWRKRYPHVVPDLRGINLMKLDLSQLRLDRVRLNNARIIQCSVRVGRLRHADLRGARLFGVDMSYADFSYADLRGIWMQDVHLTETNLQKARLRGAKLISCTLNRADLKGADLRDAFIWGTSVWQVDRDSKTQQSDISIGWDLFDPNDAATFGISKKAEADSMRVNDIVVADFMSHLTENRNNMASILNAASSKLVLLLGRFRGKQRDVLEVLERELPAFGFIPMVFDFEGPKNRDMIETVAILAGLSKFVIADLTKPRSTPLESHLIIPDMAVPFVPIIGEKDDPFSMFFALQHKYPWVLAPVRYRDEKHLIDQLKTHVIRPAEALAKKLQKMKYPKPAPSLTG